MLTAGNVSDVKAALALSSGLVACLLADNGCDADRLRRSLRDARAVPGIPGHRTLKLAIRYDEDGHRGRHIIEDPFRRTKGFRYLATRYDKLAINFRLGMPSPL